MKITSSDHANLRELCLQLAELSPGLSSVNSADWPGKQLQLCADYGVFTWFAPRAWGGQDWSDEEITRGYLQLSAACLTTTFILTQYTGALRRIVACDNAELQQSWLPDLVRGRKFSTLAISHLTTSRRHVEPVLKAEASKDGYRLTGYSPWVTGAQAADLLVTGATLQDGKQILVALPAKTPGVSAKEAIDLMGLSASQTGMVVCDGAEIGAEQIMAGPGENIMQSAAGAQTGGLQTSTLAVGLADAAIGYLEEEAGKRSDLLPSAAALRRDQQAVRRDLLALSQGRNVCSNEELRIRANSLALRSSQAALTAAKGAGYVLGHKAGRWCREAMFFLVWSCPQPVLSANLCELAGLAD